MGGESLLTGLFNYGFPAVIAVLIFFAYRDQNKALQTLVENNTRVIAEFKAVQTMTHVDLGEHDERAETISDCVDQVSLTINQVNVRTQRIEENLKLHDKTVNTKLDAFSPAEKQ